MQRLVPRMAAWQKLVIRSAAVLVAVAAGAEVAARSMALVDGTAADHRSNYFPVGLAVTAAAAVIDLGYEQLKRLEWSVDVPEELLDLEVPPLFLQPVVENAVIHGIGPKRGPGRVAVRAKGDPERLKVQVEDDGGGTEASASEAACHGRCA